MGTVHRQHAVQVVELVLEQLGPVALQLHLVPLTLEVLIADPDAVGPGDSDEKVGKREAVVPYLEVLVPDIDDLRVDRGQGLSIST